MSHHHETHEHNCDCSCCVAMKRELRCIHLDLIKVLKWIALKEIDFVQVGGNMNFSQVAGTTATFKAKLTPADGAFAAGEKPQWSTNDATIAVAPTADGMDVDITVPLPYLAPSFNLTVSGVSSDPTIGTVTNTHTITVTQPTPPPPNPLTAIDFEQTAG